MVTENAPVPENNINEQLSEQLAEHQISQSRSKRDLVPSADTKALPVKLKNKIESALAGMTEGTILRFLSESLSVEEIRQDIIKVVNKESVYLARIPKKLEDQMEKGILDFMTDSKTGDSLGVLVNEKHRSAGFVRIEEAVKVDFARSISVIAIQQQLAHVTEVIDDVRSRVIAIQEGHDNDLFGSIRGMHQQMLQMRDAKNPETRRQLATNAITVLNETRGKIEVAIENALQDMDVVSESDFGILGQIAKDKEFLSRTVEQYDRIEELTSYYLTATQLLGYTYAFLGEPASFEDIFTPCDSLIDNENLKKLQLAEGLYVEHIGDTWYKKPEMFFLGMKKEIHSLFAVPDDYVEIEITGQELLEAVENGKSETEQNN